MTGQDFLAQAVALAQANAAQGGRPFGAVVVKGGAVIATGVNSILATNDPTSHAELNAIRAASAALDSPDLSGCSVYASGHPCPMCVAAMRMAGVRDVAYVYSNEDAAPYGLSTAEIAAELAGPQAQQRMPVRHVPLAGESADALYGGWAAWRTT